MPRVLCINLVLVMIYDILYFKFVVIVAFFGGLRHCETMDLKIEKFNSSPEGIYVTHERAKQRSDKRDSKFLIPRAKSNGETNFANIVESYLHAIYQGGSWKILW